MTIKIRPRFLMTLAAVAMATLALTASSAPAALIGVDDTGVFAILPNASSFTVTTTDLSGFDPNASDKLVVTISSEKAGGGVASINGVTYDGAPLTEAVQFFSSVSNQLTGIFYLDNPSSSGDLDVDFSSTMGGIGVSTLTLSGTELGVSVVEGDDGQSIDIMTLVDDSLVVASHVNNGNSGTAQAPLIALLDADAGSAGGGSGFQNVPFAGIVTPTFTGSTTRPVTVAAAFAPAAGGENVVPEPASIAIWSILGLCLAGYGYRRRRNG